MRPAAGPPVVATGSDGGRKPFSFLGSARSTLGSASERLASFEDIDRPARIESDNTLEAGGGLLETRQSWKIRASLDNVQCQFVHQFVSHPAFRFSINLVIILSAIQMGMAADLHGAEWDRRWDACEHIFTIIFLVEMVLKLCAYHCAYFSDWWNNLDCFVAICSIMDSWILPLFFLDKGSSSGSPLKLFRLFRLMRILKMLRVVPELMLVWEGIVASLRSMFWVFLLLAVILYTVGIYCVEAVGSESAGYSARDLNQAKIDELMVDNFNSYIYFGTLTRSMVSLFSVILLSEWSPVVRPVWEKQPAVVIVFVCLVILTTFGVLNVIIGVVVERTTNAMNKLRETDIKKRKSEQMQTFLLISELMFQLDSNKDKKISRTEMEAGACSDELHSLLQKVDFPHGFTYREFHSMLDQDGSGFLSRNEFINGMLRLVYNDEFQRDCMFQLSMGQIKANQKVLHKEMKEYTNKLFVAIKREINQLRTDLSTGACHERSGDLDQEHKLSLKSLFPVASGSLDSNRLNLNTLFTDADQSGSAIMQAGGDERLQQVAAFLQENMDASEPRHSAVSSSQIRVSWNDQPDSIDAAETFLIPPTPAHGWQAQEARFAHREGLSEDGQASAGQSSVPIRRDAMGGIANDSSSPKEQSSTLTERRGPNPKWVRPEFAGQGSGQVEMIRNESEDSPILSGDGGDDLATSVSI